MFLNKKDVCRLLIFLLIILVFGFLVNFEVRKVFNLLYNIFKFYEFLFYLYMDLENLTEGFVFCFSELRNNGGCLKYRNYC